MWAADDLLRGSPGAGSYQSHPGLRREPRGARAGRATANGRGRAQGLDAGLEETLMLRFPASVKHFAVTAHPAYAMRGFPQMGPHIKEAIARGKRFATGAEERPPFDIKCQPTPAEVRAYLATRAPKAPVFIDIETPYENHEQIDIVGISVR